MGIGHTTSTQYPLASVCETRTASKYMLKLRFEIISQKFLADKSIVLRIVPKQINQIVSRHTFLSNSRK